MKTFIIGTGSWGTALAQVLADNKQDVLIYGHTPATVDEINNKHTNSKFFGNTIINPNLKATLDITLCKDADIILLGVPSIAIESICQTIDPLLTKPTIIINVAKGFHPETNERMSEVIRHSISKEHLSSVVSLIGPSHAEEVIVRLLTTVDAVGLNEEDTIIIQNLFSNDYFRVYTGSDEVGSELGVALKNVMAIASGILSGLGYQDNTRAALITRGLQEMMRFGAYFGGKHRTYIGLTGVGDLIVTCTSQHSRNFQAGYQIGKDNCVDNFFVNNTKTVEGVRTAKIVHNIAMEHGIDMPICEEVYQVLYNGKEPRDCARNLMLRELKKEF